MAHDDDGRIIVGARPVAGDGLGDELRRLGTEAGRVIQIEPGRDAVAVQEEQVVRLKRELEDTEVRQDRANDPIIRDGARWRVADHPRFNIAHAAVAEPVVGQVDPCQGHGRAAGPPQPVVTASEQIVKLPAGVRREEGDRRLRCCGRLRPVTKAIGDGHENAAILVILDQVGVSVLDEPGMRAGYNADFRTTFSFWPTCGR